MEDALKLYQLFLQDARKLSLTTCQLLRSPVTCDHATAAQKIPCTSELSSEEDRELAPEQPAQSAPRPPQVVVQGPQRLPPGPCVPLDQNKAK